MLLAPGPLSAAELPVAALLASLLVFSLTMLLMLLRVWALTPPLVPCQGCGVPRFPEQLQGGLCGVCRVKGRRLLR